MSSDLMSRNFKAEMDAIDKKLDAIAERVGNAPGQLQPREVVIKTDPNIGAEIARLRNAGASIPLNPDGSPRAVEPMIDPIAVATQQAPSLPTVAVVDPMKPQVAPPRTLTDAEIIRKVEPFLDSRVMRPVFISKPIMRRVYVGIYPTYGEMLAAEKLLGVAPRNDEGDPDVEYQFLSEISSCVRGWLFENDPGIMSIHANPGDVSQWPQLHRAEFLSALLPAMRQRVLPDLAQQYTTWKISVTPSDDELEKYYGLVK